MRRRYFQTTRTEIHRYIFVFNNRYRTVDQRNQHLLSFQVFVAFIVRVNANRTISHNGFWPCGGNRHKLTAAFNCVVDVIQLRVDIFVVHLIVRHSCFSCRVPVHHAQPAVDVPFFIQVNEYVNHGIRHGRIHRKLRPFPITRGT